MIPEKLKQLIILLTNKTKEKKALWNKGSGSNQFILSLSQGSAISISEWEDNWIEHYEVVIYNNNGDPIEKFNTEQNTGLVDLKIISDFHKAASDQFYKVDETMDAILNSVMSQDVIGTTLTPTDTKEEIDDDDLPF